MDALQLGQLQSSLEHLPLIRQRGRVTKAFGQSLEADLPGAPTGTLVEVGGVWGEVVGFREQRTVIMPLGPLKQVGRGSRVDVLSERLKVKVGPGLLGRVIDPLGQPLDGIPLIDCPDYRGLDAPPPNPLLRSRISEPLQTGIRAVDGLCNLGVGQRICVMAGSGVGKSTLLGMFARHTQADVNVIALVGERGREVREFIENDLGPEGLKRSVLVVATSDRSPIVQVKGIYTATAIAEHFRDQGKRVLFLADSLTRLAMAQRQIGLAAGEPPTTRGYTPSVFTMLPSLLERSGPGAGSGSITGIYTVLVEGDVIHDPIADTVRSIVDGHLVLSRRLANHGHYPAIDILGSLSRTMTATTGDRQRQAAARIRDILATWSENEEIIRIGAYQRGSDPAIELAIQKKPLIDGFLRQTRDDATPLTETILEMARVAREEK